MPNANESAKLIIDDAAEYMRGLTTEELLPRYDGNGRVHLTAEFTDEEREAASRHCAPRAQPITSD